MRKYEILGRMKSKHVSQKQVAKKAGVCEKTFKTHFDKNNLSSEEIHALIDLLDIADLDIPYLFF